MATALIPVPVQPAPPSILAVIPKRDLAVVAARAQERVRDYIDQSTAEATKAAYASDWQHFAGWCEELGVCPMPATVDTVIAYLSELPTMPQSVSQGQGLRKEPKIGYSVATIVRRLATVSREHKERGFPSPSADERVKRVLKGIRRSLGTATKRKNAILTEHLRPLRRDCETIHEIRNKALLLVGFAGAFRRSELVALDVSDLQFEDRMVTVYLRRSKTDQEGAGRKVVIHAGGNLCPIQALVGWLAAAGITEGAVFRNIRKGGTIGTRLSDEAVSLITKAYAAARGLNADEFGGHSLRAGHVTTAILRGEAAHAIMAITGHQSRAMVDRYFRDVEPKRHNSSANLGL